MKRNVKTKLNIHIHTYLLIEIGKKRETKSEAKQREKIAKSVTYIHMYICNL